MVARLSPDASRVVRILLRGAGVATAPFFAVEPRVCLLGRAVDDKVFFPPLRRGVSRYLVVLCTPSRTAQSKSTHSVGFLLLLLLLPLALFLRQL